MTYNKNVQILAAISLAMAALFVAKSPIFADDCTTQYSNGSYGTTCKTTEIVVNKMVKDPIKNVFVENLGQGDATYSPDSEVTFKLDIKNNSDQDLSTVNVKDTLPQHLTNATVDAQYNGSYNSSDKTLSFQLKDLKANQTRSVEVKARVTASGTFAKDTSLVCESNKVEVNASDRKDEDTAQFCVRTNVLGATTLPTAGIEDYAPFMPFIIMSVAGLALIFKKKAV